MYYGESGRRKCSLRIRMEWKRYDRKSDALQSRRGKLSRERDGREWMPHRYDHSAQYTTACEYGNTSFQFQRIPGTVQRNVERNSYSYGYGRRHALFVCMVDRCDYCY